MVPGRARVPSYTASTLPRILETAVSDSPPPERQQAVRPNASHTKKPDGNEHPKGRLPGGVPTSKGSCTPF